MVPFSRFMLRYRLLMSNTTQKAYSASLLLIILLLIIEAAVPNNLIGMIPTRTGFYRAEVPVVSSCNFKIHTYFGYSVVINAHVQDDVLETQQRRHFHRNGAAQQVVVHVQAPDHMERHDHGIIGSRTVFNTEFIVFMFDGAVTRFACESACKCIKDDPTDHEG
jgi:hypothetical protein